MTDSNSLPSSLAARLEVEDSDRAARALASPERATDICDDEGPLAYARLAERIADHLADDEPARASQLECLADAVRLDAPFLYDHPERLVETVVNRCRWFAGDRERFDALDREHDHAESREFERVEGMDELLEQWRTWDRAHRDAPRLATRRMPRDLPGEHLSMIVRGREQFNRVAWAPDGECLFAMEADRGISAWDAETGACLWRRQPEGAPDGLEYNRVMDSLVFVTRCERGENRQDYSVRVHHIDPDTGSDQRCQTVEVAPQDQFTSIARDASVALLGGFERALLFDVETGEELHAYDVQPHGGTLSRDGRYVALGRLDHRDTVLFDRKQNEQRTFDRPERGHEASSTVHALADAHLAVGDTEGSVRVWDLATDELVASFQGAGVVTDLAWATEGERLAASWLDPTEGTGHGTTLWRLDDEQLLGRLPTGVVRTNGLTFSPGDDRIAAADTDGRLRIHRLDDRDDVPPPTVPSDGVCTSALEPRRRRMAVATHRVTDPVRLFDLESGELLETLYFDGVPDALDFSGDGNHLLVRTGDDPLDNVVWTRSDSGDWQADLEIGVQLLEAFEAEPDPFDSHIYVDGTGTTHLPNPLDPEGDALTWPTPLLRMDDLDAIQMARGCPYIVAHQCNRLEIIEIVE